MHSEDVTPTMANLNVKSVESSVVNRHTETSMPEKETGSKPLCNADMIFCTAKTSTSPSTTSLSTSTPSSPATLTHSRSTTSTSLRMAQSGVFPAGTQKFNNVFPFGTRDVFPSGTREDGSKLIPLQAGHSVDDFQKHLKERRLIQLSWPDEQLIWKSPSWGSDVRFDYSRKTAILQGGPEQDAVEVQHKKFSS